MYLRTTTKKAKGKTYRYVNILESVRIDGKCRQKVVLSLGREDQIDPKRLRQIQALLAKLAGDDPLERVKGLELGASRYYGQVVVLQHLWEQMGLDKLIRGRIKERGIQVPVELLVRVMVFNRLIAPPRVEGHVLICVLAYLLARVMELRLAGAAVTWTDQIGRHKKTCPMTAGRALDLLDQVKAVEIHLDGQRVDQFTRIGPDARDILQALGVMPAQRILPPRS